jgi:hypothetical protein
MLYIGVFIERDQVSVGIKNGELFGSPRLCLKRSIWVNDRLALALAVQALDCSHLHPATRGLRNAAICAGPEVNLNRAVGDDAIGVLSHVDLREAQLGGEEIRTSLDIERGKDGNCGDELRRRAQAASCCCGSVSIDMLSLGTLACASLFKNEFCPRISPHGLSAGKTPCLKFVGRDQDLDWSGASISQVAECICGHRFPLLERVLEDLRVGSSGLYTSPLVWRVPADRYRAALHCLL